MPLSDRIEALRTRYAMLERGIDKETHRPFPNEARLAELKRRKLCLKDELAALAKGHLVTAANDRG